LLTFLVKGFMFELPLPGTLIAKGRFLGHNLFSTGALRGFGQEITMGGSKVLWATVSVLALAPGASLLPSQAVAQINIPGMVFGAIHGGIPNNNGSFGNSRRGRVHESKHERHSKDAKEEDEPSEHSSASNSKSGPEQLSAPVKSDPQPPPQPQPQTAASGAAPKSGGEEPSFSPSR
jgi:hypothetical protein